MSLTDVDTIAIGRMKGEVWKEMRWSESFPRLAYCRKGVRMLTPRYTVSGATHHALDARLRIDRDGTTAKLRQAGPKPNSPILVRR